MKLPLMVTAALVPFVLVIVICMEYRRSRSGAFAIRSAVFTGPVWVTALFAVIQMAVSAMTSGMTHYADFHAIDDNSLQWCLPPTAKDIVVYRPGHNGHCARFQMTPQNLIAWHGEVWQNHRHSCVNPADDRLQPFTATAADWPFSKLNWPMPSDLVRYRGPVRQSGAGYNICYSRQQQLAFLTCTYF